ncbi:Uncharacterised protein [Klebsiella pneumoniae]|nr:hypothetical protein BB744_00669 [Klebsiella pneumoniae]EWF70447.1 hypothetical protein L381_03406 [Klebsiella pneumoniae MGH 35]BBR81603.1 hypothetical protein WP4S18E06_06340 [Klebsiella quasipneumoniae]APU33577.1 hypothetical protein BB783_00668 [Klebsiella pneumoniae]KMG71422.1 hypothetical protein SM59_03357 [Klebsiella pneumoniae]
MITRPALKTVSVLAGLNNESCEALACYQINTECQQIRHRTCNDSWGSILHRTDNLIAHRFITAKRLRLFVEHGESFLGQTHIHKIRLMVGFILDVSIFTKKSECTFNHTTQLIYCFHFR